MKKYYVNERGTNWVYDSLEKAREKADKIGGKVESRVFWEYYAPYYSEGTSGTRQISGKDLIGAIESNFNRIIEDYGLGGGSGYKLNYVALEKAVDGAELVVDLYPLGRLGKPGNRVSKRIQIEGVEPEDLTVDKYEFELK